MEKDKGLFSFRKHPTGDFPDGKKGRKRKGGRLHRSMGFLLAAALIFNTLPASGLAVSASGREAGLCEHHRSHTSDCGYMEEQPCTHEHGEECYKTVTECVHEHTDECYPETEESTGEGSATDSGAEGREPENCTHKCSEESGCITKVLDCHHEHDESCGYKEAQDCGYVCKICNGTEPEDTKENTENTEAAGIDTAECICEILCTEDSIDGDCPVCGADDASFLDCKGKVPKENTENQEDTGICKHHQEHDADCGYIPKSEDGEGSPCTYECRICPVEDLIAALPDKVTEDNAEDVRAQLEEILALYGELNEDEQGQLDLSRIYALQGALDAANAPVQAAEEINISQNRQNILTEEAGGCPGHTFTGTTASLARIYVESGAHDVTFSDLKIIAAANVGVAPGATMNLTITGTNTIKAGDNAGIYVPKDATLVITDGSTGTLEVSSLTEAGIGGAWTAPDNTSTSGDVDCGTVVINGGTITVAGGGSISASAGIGGAGGDDNPGNGGNVTINGGTVTATGGSESGGYYGGAGIGGGSNGKSGNGGTLIINGGHVTLTAGTHDPQYPTYGFGQGSGEAPTGTYELTLADASCLAEGTTLDPNGKYTINGDPTADMIVVPEDLIYNGKAQELDGKIYIDDSKTGTGTYFEQTFTVKASAEGWELQDLGEVVGAGEYTATFKKGDKEISKTFTVAKSGTDLADGKIKTYNGSEETTSFTASDTIKVIATPTPTGAAPQGAARLRGGYTEPTAGQMAVFVNDTQVSEPVVAGADGSYTMEVSASEVLLAAGGPGTGITLTAKFVENDNMADGTGTATVNITAVAVAERDGNVIDYFGVSDFEGINGAFFNDAYAGATVTLLDDITPASDSTTGKACSTAVNITCTLDLAGHQFTSTDTAIYVLPQGNLTIQDSSTGKTGTVSSIKSDGTLTLYGGTFGKIETAYTLSSLLAENCAYYKGSTPILLSELAEQKDLAGPVTVQECQHKDVKPTSNNDGTHILSCPYCGYTKAAEDCDYGEYTHNDTSHTRICKFCGYQNVEAHNIKCTAEASGTVIAVSEACKTCGYGKDLGTVTIHIPKLVYGDLTGVVTAETTLTEHVTVAGNMENSPSGSTAILDAHATINPPTMADLTGNVLLSAGTHPLKVCISIGNEPYVVECELTFDVDPAPLTADMVTLGQTDVTYNGTEQKPTLSVKQGQTALTEGMDYEVSYTRDGVVTTDFINAGTVKITVTGKGNYTGTVTKEYAIGKADVSADALTYKQPADLLYTGQPKTAAVTVNSLTGIGTVTVKYKKDNSGDLLAEAKEPGTYHVYADISAGQNYNAAQIEKGSFTISYMETPTVLYNGGEKKDWYNGDVDVSAGSPGYTVSDTLGGEYKASYTISAQEGTVAKTLYFKDADGHISAGVDVEVKFDLTPPTGEIAVGAKWWQNVLHFISFGNYKAKEYTITIEAEDKNGSGISKIEYVVKTGTDQYTNTGALEAAGLRWTEYNSGSQPTVDANTSQYVVYARLTDNAGNTTYISTDGILLDNTPPAVKSLSVPEETKKDVTAGVTFTVSETADYYYVVLPQGSAVPSAEDIIVTCGGTLPDGGTGTAIVGSVDSGKGAVSGDAPSVSVDVKNLQPNTAYMVYVTAVDRALDITNSADGTPAGNIADVVNTGFTTKKTLPVITKAPAVAGTYGQSVGEMTITGGTAQAGSTVLAGTWAASDTDRNKKPSAGTAEVTVIFTPESDIYDSVSVQAPLTVSQRNLNAKGVTVSEVAGNYTYTGSEIKPPVAVDTGTPTSGISISDSEAALTANDFTVSYSNNKDAGTASVTITGKGNYTGLVTKTFAIAKASGREVPDLTGSYTDNGQTYTYTVTLTEGAVYRMGNDGKWQEGNVFEGITPGTSVIFSAKMPETGNYKDGTPKSITVDFPKLTPAAPALSYTRQTETGTGEITITITPVEGAEYSFDDGVTWKSGEGANVQGGFTTSDTVILAIRLKETDTHNQSPVQTVTVDLAKKDKGAPHAFSLKAQANGETDYTVTIPPTEGCEYSFDGETWSDNNVKTGVSVGETVTGYKRYKETDDYNASSAVSAKETMPKFTVKTPLISPAGGNYSGSVSVTITCGSNDAEIYYTTDGSTPDRGSARYTGAFTVTVPATVKAVAIKDGLDDSAVATASYKKKSGGGSGGGNSGDHSGGNEDNGGGNSGGNGNSGGGTNPGNGNTTPQPSVTPPTDTNTNPGNETAPGTGTTPVNPGSGNTVRPGTAPGSGTGTPAQGTKQPFIKGEDGKTGWDVIRAEEELAQEGSTINVDMNGSVVVPGDIFDSIKGKDITITFDMGNGILWSVDGKSITTDKAGDIDFSVKIETNAIPVDIVNNVTGECYSIQISLAHEGEFGFTAVLSIGLGKENAGYTASLYYYNESTGELEFICSDEVAEDGTVSLAFTHASDYVIAIDGDGEEENSMEEMAQPQAPAGTEESAGDIPKSPQTGQEEKNVLWPIVAGIIAFAGVAFAGVFVWKKKEGNGAVKEGK